jgi:hypothetical protein
LARHSKRGRPAGHAPFGALAALQAAGNVAASVIARILWTAISPAAAFVHAAAWMAPALAGVTLGLLGTRSE